MAIYLLSKYIDTDLTEDSIAESIEQSNSQTRYDWHWTTCQKWFIQAMADHAYDDALVITEALVKNEWRGSSKHSIDILNFHEAIKTLSLVPSMKKYIREIEERLFKLSKAR